MALAIVSGQEGSTPNSDPDSPALPAKRPQRKKPRANANLVVDVTRAAMVESALNKRRIVIVCQFVGDSSAAQRTEGEAKRTEGEAKPAEGEAKRTEGEAKRTEGEAKSCEGVSPPLFHWFAIDAVCFHQQQSLCGGKLVKVLADIEQLGESAAAASACPGGGLLCIECPGHEFLFSVATGDNVVARPQLIDGRMQVRAFKAVKGIQRPYLCEFEAGKGLFVRAQPETTLLSFASDR